MLRKMISSAWYKLEHPSVYSMYIYSCYLIIIYECSFVNLLFRILLVAGHLDHGCGTGICFGVYVCLHPANEGKFCIVLPPY